MTVRKARATDQTAHHVGKKALLILLLPCLVLSIMTCSPRDTQRGTALYSARIDFLDGEVTVNGKPATLRQSLEATDTIKTGPDSSTEIVFNTSNVIHLEENSELKLSLLAANPAVELQSGALVAVLKRLKRLSKEEQQLITVRAPTAVGSVRGTSFFVKVENSLNIKRKWHTHHFVSSP